MPSDNQLEKVFRLAKGLPQFRGIEDTNLRDVIQQRYGNTSPEKVQALIEKMEGQIKKNEERVRNNADLVKNLQVREAHERGEDEENAAQLLKAIEDL